MDLYVPKRYSSLSEDNLRSRLENTKIRVGVKRLTGSWSIHPKLGARIENWDDVLNTS